MSTNAVISTTLSRSISGSTDLTLHTLHPCKGLSVMTALTPVELASKSTRIAMGDANGVQGRVRTKRVDDAEVVRVDMWYQVKY